MTMRHPAPSTALGKHIPILILAAVVIAAAVVAAVLFSRPSQTTAAKATEVSPLATGKPLVQSVLDSSASASPEGMAGKNAATPVPDTAPVAALAARLRSFAEDFRSLAEDKSLDPEQRKARARDLLAGLRRELRAAPADQATAAVLNLLASGQDVPTGLGFTLAGGGILDDAPSFRTSLLDMLGQLDPGASVDYARTIFADSSIADEWALGMRSLGWQNHAGEHTAELRTRLNDMLDNQAWLAKPSEGFLEAFDIAAHLGGVEELSAMASVMHIESTDGSAQEQGTTHAGYVALDRIVASHPDQALAALAGDSELLAWAPEHRGALLARADVSQPAQRAAIETYLATLAQRPTEMEAFTGLFPNRNGLLGNALVTTPRIETGFETMLAQDQAALAVVQQWITENRYPAIDSNLRQIAGRLTGFVRDATDSPSQAPSAPRSPSI